MGSDCGVTERGIISGEGEYWDAWGHWTTDKVITTHQCGFWKSRSVRGGFVTYFAFVVRDGSRVRFWHDTWCRYHTLKRIVS